MGASDRMVVRVSVLQWGRSVAPGMIRREQKRRGGLADSVSETRWSRESPSFEEDAPLSQDDLSGSKETWWTVQIRQCNWMVLRFSVI